MSLRLKKILLLSGFAILCFHFGMLFIAANPFSQPKSKIVFWADYYTYPYFLQTWNLFAPPPQSNYKLFASYELGGKHKEDIYSEIVQAHQNNRLKGYEPLLLAFTSGIHYFEKRALASGISSGPMSNNQDLIIVERMAANYLKHKYSKPVRDLKLMLLITDELSGQQRVYYK